MQENKIIVLDFGAQYAHLIARRVRELKVYSEILEPTVSVKELEKAKGVILSGGPSSVYENDAPKFNKKIFSLKVPILGLCYGHQLLAHELGGKVKAGKIKEYGIAELEIKNRETLFEGLSEKEIVWMSHGDTVEQLPSGFEVIGSTSDCVNAAVADFKRNYFGLQFHPEVTHTEHGIQILKNFVFKVCKCKANWTMENYIKQKVEELKKKVADKKVFFLVSGGVDSTVALCLLNKSLPNERIYAMHVDTGFMRQNETKLVKEALEKLNLSKLHVVDASNEFFEALKEVISPEQKRKIIGDLFVKITNNAIQKLNLNPMEWLLGQGTIYPDTIETAGTKHASKIKTHHNRIDSIKQLIEAGKVVEPISQLYKDEVRELGLKLGLPKEIVFRHPFPGPGLAIRALCSTGKTEDNLKEIEVKVKELVGKEFNAVVLPVKSVGVQGDARSYKHAVLLAGTMDWNKLERISTKLTNNVSEINRVVYSVYPTEINSVKLLAKDLSRKRIDLLREADAIVMDAVRKFNLMNKIWQFPTILLPVALNSEKESVVLRPVLSREAMTAKFAPLPKNFLEEVKQKLLKLEIGAVLVDVTHKPPGTIEWE